MPANKGANKGAKCGSCAKVVGDLDNGVQCEVCGSWYHSKCQDLGDALYNAMSQCDTVHWFCGKCNAGAEKLLGLLVRLENRIEVLEHEIVKIQKEGKESHSALAKQIENETKRLEDKLEESKNTIRAEIETLIEQKIEDAESKQKTSVEPKWADIVSKEVDTKLDKVTNDVVRVQSVVEETRVRAEEQRERESRVNNIVIYNMEEKRSDNKEEWFKNEKSSCMHLFNTVLQAGVENKDIKKMIRLGARATNTKRPLLVQFHERRTKNIVMENLRRLREAQPPFNEIGVNHDMTKSEREEVKKMVKIAEEKEKNEGQGEWIFRVRGSPGNMTVVKLKKRT